MYADDCIKVLEENGAQKEFFEICNGPMFKLDGKYYRVGTLPISLGKFIHEYINNLEKEFPIYIFEITQMYIKFTEIKDRHLNKRRILRKIRTDKIQKVIERTNATQL